ncbi:hypothetical protein [Allochromatium vinosum]|uniref:hypothetical protein n=1 Tax=Allochromatium vinosum TaxID=1049 RepID=UPI00190388CA|nr:hypothetical protein [Allochromatium vinosum]
MEEYKIEAADGWCEAFDDLPDSLQVRGIPVKAILCVTREHERGALYHHAYQIALEYRQRITLESALSSQAAAGYLAVIAALTRALADLKPEELKRSDGLPLVGYSKPTGDTGIVGYLKSNRYSLRSDADLQKKISDALKLSD